jgi:hypothetical protein
LAVFGITQYYAVGELSQALQGNRPCRVWLYASRCDRFMYACNRFGAYFSDTVLINPNPKTLLLIAGKMGGFHMRLISKKNEMKAYGLIA